MSEEGKQGSMPGWLTGLISAFIVILLAAIVFGVVDLGRIVHKSKGIEQSAVSQLESPGTEGDKLDSATAVGQESGSLSGTTASLQTAVPEKGPTGREFRRTIVWICAQLFALFWLLVVGLSFTTLAAEIKSRNSIPGNYQKLAQQLSGWLPVCFFLAAGV